MKIANAGSGLGRPARQIDLDEMIMAAWLILETGYGTITELGKVTRRDTTTLSTIAKNLQAKAKGL